MTGINRFYYLRGFMDMRCKHSRVLSVIHEQLHCEPSDGDIYIVMSKDRRIVCLFAYDNRSYNLFEKKFVAGYQFMRIIRDDEGNEVSYRIDLKDVVLLLAYIIHSGFISGYQNRYGDNLKPPTNVYHRMTA